MYSLSWKILRASLRRWCRINKGDSVNKQYYTEQRNRRSADAADTMPQSIIYDCCMHDDATLYRSYVTFDAFVSSANIASRKRGG